MLESRFAHGSFLVEFPRPINECRLPNMRQPPRACRRLPLRCWLL
jgi:hypothetical protein